MRRPVAEGKAAALLLDGGSRCKRSAQVSEAALPPGVRSRIGAERLLSDDRLARRAVDGDERAFSAIFSRYHQDLYRFCMAIVGNPQDAQDALQNTMVKVLRALPGETRQIKLKPWLYRIAHNESVELLRRRRPTEELDPELLTRGGGLTEEAEMRERLRRLIADLEQLPERQRGTLIMRELAGLHFAEIGAVLGTSAAVARQTLYEARLSLRRMGEGREMTCDAVTRTLSDADGRVTRRRDIRAHLRACPDCRRFGEEVAARRDDLAALSPLPAMAAVGLLQGLLGGTAGSAGSSAGLAGAVGGGAAKSLGATAAIKAAAAVAVVAAVGVGAADRGGVVDVTPWGDGGSKQTQSERTQGEQPAGAAGPRQSAGSGAGEAGGSKPGSAAVTPGTALDAGAHHKQTGKGDVGAGPGTANGDTPAAVAPDRGSSASHPHGRGHEKQHPPAAAKGQQTAATHKATGKGAGGRGGGSSKDHPPQSTKPVKPSKPSKPAGEGGAKADAAPKAPADPGAAAPPQPGSSPQSSDPIEPSVLPEAGKQA
jgi:RNA polymerase sigma factor (sigma-70 family)